MKISERKARFLERQCFKNAGRARNREEFLQVRIQTSSPFERIMIFCVGVLVAAIAVWAYVAKDSMIAALIVGAFGLVLLAVGLRGRKSTVDVVFRGLDASITNSILDAIF